MKNLPLLFLLTLFIGACDDPSGPNDGIPKSITGKVQLFNSDEGKPYEDHSGVTVAIRGTSFSTTTNSAGEYTINGVPPGLYVFSYAKPEFDSSFANVEYSGVGVEFLNTVTVRSQFKVHRLDGHVTLLAYNDSISDQSGVDVTILETGLTTRTDANGNYTFSNAPAGSYEVLITKLGFDSARFTFSYSGKGVSTFQPQWLRSRTWIWLDSLWGGKAEDLVDSDYVNGETIPDEQQVLIAISRSGNVPLDQLKFTLYDGDEQTPDIEIPALAFKQVSGYYLQVLDRSLVEQSINEGKGDRGRMRAEVPGRIEVSNVQNIPRL